jgi:hypothetical protein
MTGRSLRLKREKEIGGMKEFVVTDSISFREKKIVFVVEGKKSSTEKTLKQCALSMKDMRDNNGVRFRYNMRYLANAQK